MRLKKLIFDPQKFCQIAIMAFTALCGWIDSHGKGTENQVQLSFSMQPPLRQLSASIGRLVLSGWGCVRTRGNSWIWTGINMNENWKLSTRQNLCALQFSIVLGKNRTLTHTLKEASWEWRLAGGSFKQTCWCWLSKWFDLKDWVGITPFCHGRERCRWLALVHRHDRLASLALVHRHDRLASLHYCLGVRLKVGIWAITLRVR